MRAIRGDPAASFNPSSGNELDDLWVDDLRKSSYGHIPTIAKRLVCSPQTVRNYRDRKNSEGEYTKLALQVQKALKEEEMVKELDHADFNYELISTAEKALLINVKLLNQPAIKFVLERLDKEHYAARTEMTGADGKALFDSETMGLLDEMGINVEEAMRVAAQNIKAKLQAAANKGKDDTHSMERGE